MTIIDLLAIFLWGYFMYLLFKRINKKFLNMSRGIQKKAMLGSGNMNTNARLQFIISTVGTYIDYHKSKGVDANSQTLARQFFVEAYSSKKGKEPDEELTVCFRNVENENNDYNVPDWLNVYAGEWLANHELS